MQHKVKSVKDSNEVKIDLESIEVQTVSTSNNFRNNEQIKMVIFSFKLGTKRVSQTRHMTDSEICQYKKAPSIAKITNASKNKGLQDIHTSLNGGTKSCKN